MRKAGIIGTIVLLILIITGAAIFYFGGYFSIVFEGFQSYLLPGDFDSMACTQYPSKDESFLKFLNVAGKTCYNDKWTYNGVIYTDGQSVIINGVEYFDLGGSLRYKKGNIYPNYNFIDHDLKFTGQMKAGWYYNQQSNRVMRRDIVTIQVTPNCVITDASAAQYQDMFFDVTLISSDLETGKVEIKSSVPFTNGAFVCEDSGLTELKPVFNSNLKLDLFTFKFPTGCKKKAGEEFVMETRNGDDPDRRTFDFYSMDFPVIRFCAEPGTIIIRPDGVDETSEPQARMISGESITVPEGEIWVIQYFTPVSEVPLDCKDTETYYDGACEDTAQLILSLQGLDLVTETGEIIEAENVTVVAAKTETTVPEEEPETSQFEVTDEVTDVIFGTGDVEDIPSSSGVSTVIKTSKAKETIETKSIFTPTNIVIVFIVLILSGTVIYYLKYSK